MLFAYEDSAQCFLIFQGVMKAFSTVSACAVTTWLQYRTNTIKQRLSLIPGFTIFISTCTSIRVIFSSNRASSFLIQQEKSFYSLTLILICISLCFNVCIYILSVFHCFHGYYCLSKVTECQLKS
jgi:hypothetical protein